jgi:CheY-like chemotaxis protein
VDDDRDICTVVQAKLRLIGGLEVHTADSGEQAVDLAYKLRPDLILMDVMMPGLDGPATFEHLREHAPLADIPIIFFTAKVLPAEVAHLIKLGAIGVIGKPFDPLKLSDEVFAIWKIAEAQHGSSATTARQSQVREQTGSLTDTFIRRSKNDLVRLRTIIERARHEDRSVLGEAERIAHTIRGTGAMFGFLEVSAAGGAIERLIERITSSASTPGSTCEPALLQQLLAFTNRLALDVELASKLNSVAPRSFMG